MFFFSTSRKKEEPRNEIGRLWVCVENSTEHLQEYLIRSARKERRDECGKSKKKKVSSLKNKIGRCQEREVGGGGGVRER